QPRDAVERIAPTHDIAHAPARPIAAIAAGRGAGSPAGTRVRAGGQMRGATFACGMAARGAHAVVRTDAQALAGAQGIIGTHAIELGERIDVGAEPLGEAVER